MLFSYTRSKCEVSQKVSVPKHDNGSRSNSPYFTLFKMHVMWLYTYPLLSILAGCTPLLPQNAQSQDHRWSQTLHRSTFPLFLQTCWFRQLALRHRHHRILGKVHDIVMGQSGHLEEGRRRGEEARVHIYRRREEGVRGEKARKRERERERESFWWL